MRKGSRCSRDLRTKSLCSQSKTQCQTQTGFRGFFSLANRPKNWKLNQEHLFRHMVHTFYRKDDLPLEHLSSSSTNVTSLDTKHFTGFFSKRYVLFQPELIWEKCGLCNPHVWGFRLADCSVFLEPENCHSKICLLIRQKGSSNANVCWKKKFSIFLSSFFRYSLFFQFEDVSCRPMIVNPSLQKPSKKKWATKNKRCKIHRERES